MLDLGMSEAGWIPPVLLASATTGQGVAALWAAIEEHRTYLSEGGLLGWRRGERLVEEMQRIVVRALVADAPRASDAAAGLAITTRLRERHIDPYDAAEQLLAALAGSLGYSPS
jgi:LAO/AO transport system kinase